MSRARIRLFVLGLVVGVALAALLRATYTPGGPGYQLAYVEFTSAVTISATTEATANSVVSAGAVSFDGATPVIIEFFAVISQPAASAGSNLIYYLYEDGASIGQLGQHQNPASSSNRVPVLLRRRMTPTSGSHTYEIRVVRGVGNGSVRAGVGGSGNEMPGYIRITVS